VLENLLFEFQPTHGKERRGNPMPTKEIKTTAM
jgi:hypothetical protein